MSDPTEAELEARVRAALEGVVGPDGLSLIASGRVRGLVVRQGAVGFVIEAEGADPSSLISARDAAEAAVRALPGVTRATVVLTAHDAPTDTHASAAIPRAPASRRRVRLSDAVEADARPAPDSRASGARPAGRAASLITLDGVKAVIAVASGKGGVGKSTLAANLACALARRGGRIGLLDADIYGPSAPILMGLVGAEPSIRPDRKLEAPVAYGVKVMSVGFLTDPEKAMVWRGPIVMSVLSQMLTDVAWGPLDVLVLDLPPGTGDAQITLTQRLALSGAVIVSTPQEVALADVRRGVAMFRATHVPILGVVETMSAMRGPDGAVLFAPFGTGGARRAAAAMDAPFLAEVPLDPALAAASDAGEPPAVCAPQSPSGRAFDAIAAAVEAALAAGPGREPPQIVFE